MKIAYIALGTNLGNRIENLKRALRMLNEDENIFIQTVSSIYETAPVGGPDQGPFLNACAELNTNLSPQDLLAKMLSIEDRMGRVREEKWGPRLIDLDLLTYENQIINTDFLKLPHPLMEERDFVMAPLNEIAAALVLPGRNKSVHSILNERKLSPDIKLLSPIGWHET